MRIRVQPVMDDVKVSRHAPATPPVVRAHEARRHHNVGWWLLCFAACMILPASCKKVQEQPYTTQTTSLSGTPPVRQTGSKKTQPLGPGRSWGLVPSGQSSPVETRVRTTGGPPPDTLNGDPEGLKREALQQSLTNSLGPMAGCFAGTDVKSAVVSFEADPSGATREVRITGAPQEAADCVAAVITQVQFPPFKGDPVPIDYPISIHTAAANPRPTEATESPVPQDDSAPAPSAAADF